MILQAVKVFNMSPLQSPEQSNALDVPTAAAQISSGPSSKLTPYPEVGTPTNQTPGNAGQPQAGALASTKSFDNDFASTRGAKRPNKVAFAVALIALTFIFAEVLARVVAVTGQFNPAVSDEFADKMLIANRASTQPALIFLGSSYTESAVYSELLSGQLRQAGYAVDVKNLAMTGEGASPNVQLKLLKAAVESGTKPIAVFYDVSPLFGFLVNSHSRIPDTNVPVYLLAYRARYGELLRSLPQIILAPHTVTAAGFLAKRQTTSPDGWLPRSNVVNSETLQSSLMLRRKLIESHQMSRKFYEVLSDVKQFCDSKQIPFVLVWYPTMPQSDALYANLGVTSDNFYALMNDAVNIWHVRFMNLHGALNSLNFADCEHLNTAGADRVTSKISQTLMSDGFVDMLSGAHQ